MIEDDDGAADWLAEQREAFHDAQPERWKEFIESEEVKDLWKQAETEAWAEWLEEAREER